MNYFFLKIVCGLVVFSSMASAFEFRRAAEHMEEVGTIVVCILEDAKGNYAFRPPYNWDVRFDEGFQTVTLAPKKDPKSWITIRLAALTNSPGAGVQAYVKSAFPKAEIEEHFQMHTVSKEADVADFIDPSAGAIPLKRRAALVSSPSGIFEFLLSSRPDHFKVGEQAFGQLMISFEFRGPPEKPPADKAPAASGP